MDEKEFHKCLRRALMNFFETTSRLFLYFLTRAGVDLAGEGFLQEGWVGDRGSMEGESEGIRESSKNEGFSDMDSGFIFIFCFRLEVCW